MPNPIRFRVEENKPYVLRMPCSEAMMSLRAHGHLQLLRVRSYEASWGTDYAIDFGERFVFNYPNDPGDFSGHYADITELLQNLNNVQWRAPGYTYSEVGLFRDEEGLYGYLPNMNEEPEEIQRQAAALTESLMVIFHNANAERIK